MFETLRQLRRRPGRHRRPARSRCPPTCKPGRPGSPDGSATTHRQPQDPFVVVLVDEVAFLTAYQADRKLRERILAALATLTTQGRAVGYCVVAALPGPPQRGPEHPQPVPRQDRPAPRRTDPGGLGARRRRPRPRRAMRGHLRRPGHRRWRGLCPAGDQTLTRSGCGPRSSPTTDIHAMTAMVTGEARLTHRLAVPRGLPGVRAGRCSTPAPAKSSCSWSAPAAATAPAGTPPTPTGRLRPRDGDRMTQPTTRAQRLAMPLARDVVRDLAVSHGGCVRPVQLRRTDMQTGQTEPVLVPCGHTLASVCPSCAERNRVAAGGAVPGGLAPRKRAHRPGRRARRRTAPVDRTARRGPARPRP